MKVILLSNIEKVGRQGDLLNVKSGFARNYLIPRKLALYATPQNMKKLSSIQAQAAEEEARIMAELKKLDARIRSLSLDFVRKVDEHDHMFGSVSEVDIVSALQEKGVSVHKSQLVMDKHIKALGESLVQIRLHRDLVSELRIQVEKEHEEKAQPKPVETAEPEAVADAIAAEPDPAELAESDLEDEV